MKLTQHEQNHARVCRKSKSTQFMHTIISLHVLLWMQNQKQKMISTQIKLLFLLLTRKRLLQHTLQKKIQMNHRERVSANFSETKTFWSNSEREQIIKAFIKCFTLSRKLTSWICFNDSTNIAIQYLKKWQNYDSASNEFKNHKNWHHSNSETVLLQEYDYHALFTEL